MLDSHRESLFNKTFSSPEDTCATFLEASQLKNFSENTGSIAVWYVWACGHSVTYGVGEGGKVSESKKMVVEEKEEESMSGTGVAPWDPVWAQMTLE